MICPKCQYLRTEHDNHVLAGTCPSCGIAYEKWLEWQAIEAARAARASTQGNVQTTDSSDASMPDVQEPGVAWRRRFIEYTCSMPSDRHEAAFWGHLVLYVIFVIWGWSFILHGVDWNYIGSSVLHYPNLAFHEFGHITFSGFGRFWTILGGSVFQILLPLILLFGFMVQQRDNFPASLMLWWCGQNFIDVSPYIADAPIRALPLTTGNDDSHDWWNLLTMLDQLDMAGFYAGLCFLIGALLIVTSNVWGGFLLWVEFTGRTGYGKETEVE